MNDSFIFYLSVSTVCFICMYFLNADPFILRPLNSVIRSGSVLAIGEGNGNPLQCSCLENPRDGEARWAAVYGVAQNQTRLKRLSSSSSILDLFCFSVILLEYTHTIVS